jgi:anaerobic nitric oxide reductase transcription regulator
LKRPRTALFLDEVSDLSLSAQAKLLRDSDLAVERVGGQSVRRLDIESWRPPIAVLRRWWSSGCFVDLYRLSGVDIRVRASVAPAGHSELASCSSAIEPHACAPSPGASDALMAHDWPGNVRELND